MSSMADADFGASNAAKYAAAVINGDIPDVKAPNDFFGDEESDEDDLSVLKSKVMGDDRLDAASAALPMVDGEVGVAGAIAKKKRQPRPKLDANVLCNEQYGLANLLARSKSIVKENSTPPSVPRRGRN
jgi:hypothetical protein